MPLCGRTDGGDPNDLINEVFDEDVCRDGHGMCRGAACDHAHLTNL